MMDNSGGSPNIKTTSIKGTNLNMWQKMNAEHTNDGKSRKKSFNPLQ